MPHSGGERGNFPCVNFRAFCRPVSVLWFSSPQKRETEKALQELASLPYPIVFYESPRRIEETLGFVLDIMGDRKIAVVKEMTKVFETTYRGTVNEVIDSLSADEKLGEYAFIVAGHEK